MYYKRALNLKTFEFYLNKKIRISNGQFKKKNKFNNNQYLNKIKFKKKILKENFFFFTKYKF